MKITIITVCYNRASTIQEAMRSVLQQDYPDLEYIVVDGASTDGTQQAIQQVLDSRLGQRRNVKYLSEPDHGMYEALNKALRMATGDVIGMLHSDDLFFDRHVLSKYAQYFRWTKADLVYADSIYVKQENIYRIQRCWHSGAHARWKVRLGWLPSHPTTFIRHDVLEREGVLYDESYRIAADSKWLVHYLYNAPIRISYMRQVVVRFRLGGLSTDKRRFRQVWDEDIRFLREVGFTPAPLFKILKMSWKVPMLLKAYLKNKLS